MICADIYYPKIGAAFHIYEAFKSQSKIAISVPVALRQPKPNVEYVGVSQVEMGWAKFACELEVTKSPKMLMKYGLKVIATELDGKPCLRFKSRGSVHFNTEAGGGLAERGVETPAFYRVDNRGILEAYKTPPLDNPVEREKIVSDPQLGTNYFCQEANLFSPSGRTVVLDIIVSELDLSTTDPLSGATFPT